MCEPTDTIEITVEYSRVQTDEFYHVFSSDNYNPLYCRPQDCPVCNAPLPGRVKFVEVGV